MFEEAALLEALATVVDRANQAKLIVPVLVDALLYLGLRASAAQVEHTLAVLLETIAARYAAVWAPDALGLGGPVAGGGLGAGADGGPFGANATANSRVEQFLARGGVGGGASAAGAADDGIGVGGGLRRVPVVSEKAPR